MKLTSESRDGDNTVKGVMGSSTKDLEEKFGGRGVIRTRGQEIGPYRTEIQRPESVKSPITFGGPIQGSYMYITPHLWKWELYVWKLGGTSQPRERHGIEVLGKSSQ